MTYLHVKVLERVVYVKILVIFVQIDLNINNVF